MPVEALVTLARAMSDPMRVRILALICGREVCVCELCEVLGARQSTLSTHLAAIRRAGIARARREGRWMHYSLAPAWRARVMAFLALAGPDAGPRGWRSRDEGRLRACQRAGSPGPCREAVGATKREGGHADAS